MHTNTWKQLERDSAKVLGGIRVSRGANFGIDDVDVKIDDFPSFKVDSKRYKRFAVFSLYETVKKKYCKKPEDEPILILRQSGKHNVLAVINLDLLGKILNIIRKKGAQDELK
jgi:hypothetical protein